MSNNNMHIFPGDLISRTELHPRTRFKVDVAFIVSIKNDIDIYVICSPVGSGWTTSYNVHNYFAKVDRLNR